MNLQRNRLCSRFRFDLESNKWKVLEPMNVARKSSSVAVQNGYIYVVGGTLSGDCACGAVELYDIANDHWKLVASMNEVRSSFALFKSNMCLYAIGTNKTVEQYDALKDKWTKVCYQFEKKRFLFAFHGGFYVAFSDGIIPGEYRCDELS